MRTERFAALALGVSLLSACARPPEPPGTTLHLAPLLGGASPVGVPLSGSSGGELGGPQDITRQTIALPDGARRSCAAHLPGAADLLFALALTGPGSGDWTLDIRGGGSLLARETLSSKRWNMWTTFVVPVARSLDEVTFEAHHEGGAGPETPSLLLGSPRFERRPGRPPRVIVWISQDALGADHMEAYGYSRSTTPFFTKRAASLVLFEDAVAPATWTLPSLASAFTSRYPPFHGAVQEEWARDESTPTLFEILAAQGFTTLGVTGNRFVGPYFHMVNGLDAVFYTPGRADDVVRQADAALDEWRGGDLALFVHFMDTHFPYDPPAPYAKTFDHDYKGAITGRTFFDARKDLTPRDVDHVRALYDGAALFADSQIEALLAKVEARGVPKDRLLVYSADHGEGFLEHGRFLHAGTVYRELTHVPLALGLPGIAPQRVSQVVSLIDLAPTLLAALGIPSPPSFGGRSLLPLLRNGTLPTRPAISETQVTNNNRFWKVAAVSEGEALLAKLPRGADPTEGLTTLERFDRSRDPGEAHPLPPRDGPLKDFLLAYLKSAHSGGAHGAEATLPPDVRERLRALGYLHE